MDRQKAFFCNFSLRKRHKGGIFFIVSPTAAVASAVSSLESCRAHATTIEAESEGRYKAGQALTHLADDALIPVCQVVFPAGVTRPHRPVLAAPVGRPVHGADCRQVGVVPRARTVFLRAPHPSPLLGMQVGHFGQVAPVLGLYEYKQLAEIVESGDNVDD